MFFETHPDGVERASEVCRDSPFRIAYEEYKPLLLAASEVHQGVRSLVLGPAVIPTFDRLALSFASGSAWSRPRTTVSRIYTVIEGTGTARGDGFVFDWKPGDMFVIPGWHESQLAANDDAVLVQVSDQPLLSVLNWVRVQFH